MLFALWTIILEAVLLTSFLSVSATNNKRFPANFMFGVGTSAYQIEGSWNVDGKSESLWDNYIHTHPNFVIDNSTGDVACDSYNRWKDDIAILKELGVNHYRFSIAWTRILPTGCKYNINQKGIDYYKTLIDALKENNIEPMVTMFHWDTPLILQNLGGFLNRSIADSFADYARVLFENFGDDVKYWFTFNEPKTYCNGGYGYGYNPPQVHSEGILEYVCAHNLLRAHAKAYRVYDQEFRGKQNGKVSIVLDSSYYDPNTTSSRDKEAADQVFQFELGWFANPVHYGDYPEIMKTRIASRSAAEGRNKSRLPEFTDKEKVLLQNSTDFFALNTYTGNVVVAIPDVPVTDPPTRSGDIGVLYLPPRQYEPTTADWLKVAPYGMRILLNWIKSNYGDPEIIVTENGYTDYGGLEDPRRIAYHRDYLSYTRDAMDKDGVRVIAYTAWSLMDNLEWASGFTQKFGLYSVDFNSENRTRTPKQSAIYYQKVCKTKCLVDKCVD